MNREQLLDKIEEITDKNYRIFIFNGKTNPLTGQELEMK
jgi:hypothetical protein